MPMIDSDHIKPASDAVQAAFEAWKEAGQHEGWLRQNRPQDDLGIGRAQLAKKCARDRYDQALLALAKTTREVIARAQRE